MTRTETGACLHNPVLLGQIIAALAPRGGEAFLDGTFGAGGYSRALLEAANCRVFAIDRDPTAVSLGLFFEQEFEGRFTMMEGRFSEMQALLSNRGVEHVDGVALDLGVSSMQIDEPERGFSFRADGPLDMRMECTGESAADVINSRDADELARIFRDYGEERHARRIAKAIIARRTDAPFERTADLAELISRVVGHQSRKGASAIHPATRVFQALRIYVNRELEELEAGLLAAERVLAENGRLCIVSFHSLEDRIVKQFLRQRSASGGAGSRHLPPNDESRQAPTFTLPQRRAIRPDDDEVAANPRARSARLRVAHRTSAPPQSVGAANLEMGGAKS